MLDYSTMKAGPEMDALVAERAMGWTVVKEPPSFGPWYGATCHNVRGGLAGIATRPVPRYSTNDTDALRVLDKLHSGDDWYDSELSFTRGRGDGEYCCCLFRGGNLNGLAPGMADTRALAICRAALMTGKEADHEKQE
jgi:hypothetical protein